MTNGAAKPSPVPTNAKEAKTLKYFWLPALPTAYKKGRTEPIANIILHASCGHQSGDIPTLRGEDAEHLVSSHWYVCKNGDIYHFVDDADTAYHAGVVDEASHSNAATIGIEQENNGEEWGDTLVQSTANLVAALYQKHGKALPVLSHASVARPVGRKTDPERFPWALFSTMVNAAAQQTWTFEQIP